MSKRPDLYISGDIEADGPIPGEYSMLALGLAVAGRFDGAEFTPSNPDGATFYRELRPISARYDPDALAATGLDRSLLEHEGGDPVKSMRAASEWIATRAGSDRPVLVGYPVVFDWLFLQWYFVRFAGGSPFGFSSALDMKTIYQQKAATILDLSGRSDLPAFLKSRRQHTHNALEDAIEQAEIFSNLFMWKRSTTNR